VVGTSIWILRPFVHHTPWLIALVQTLRAIGPITTAVSLGIAVVVLISGRLKWSWLLLIPLAAGAFMAPVHSFYWVFAPSCDVEIVPIATLPEIAPTDMAIGVSVDWRSRAYPVRLLAYHHMLNDQLGSSALLPTY